MRHGGRATRAQRIALGLAVQFGEPGGIPNRTSGQSAARPQRPAKAPSHMTCPVNVSLSGGYPDGRTRRRAKNPPSLRRSQVYPLVFRQYYRDSLTPAHCRFRAYSGRTLLRPEDAPLPLPRRRTEARCTARQPGEVIMSTDIKTVVLDWTDAINRRDPDAAAAYFAPDGHLTDADTGRRVQGREAIRGMDKGVHRHVHRQGDREDRAQRRHRVRHGMGDDRCPHRRHARPAGHRTQASASSAPASARSGTGRSCTSPTTGTWPTSSARWVRFRRGRADGSQSCCRNTACLWHAGAAAAGLATP